jgi:hypothetical protein
MWRCLDGANLQKQVWNKLGVRKMIKKSLLSGLLLSSVAFGFYMTMYPAGGAIAQVGVSPNATNAGHGTHACNAASPLDPIDGVLTSGGRPLTRMMIGNFSATPVFLISQNGNPAAQGWPICNDPLLCASSVSLPVFGAVLSCAPTAGTVTVNIFGTR